MKRLIWWIIHKFTAINAKFSKIKMVFTTYLPTLLSTTYYYLLAPYVFIEVHTMKKKIHSAVPLILGQPHTYARARSRARSLNWRKTQQPTTLMISHDDYLYLRLCMKNLSMIMIKNKQKIKTKIDPFWKEKNKCASTFG